MRALLNVSINGPEHMSDKEVLEIAEKWMKSKDRRTSLIPCKKLSATDTDENVMDDDSECCGIAINDEYDDELDMNVFWT